MHVSSHLHITLSLSPNIEFSLEAIQHARRHFREEENDLNNIMVIELPGWAANNEQSRFDL